MANKRKIVFYLDTTVSEFEKTKMIIEDYAYWFKNDTDVELLLFASTVHPSDLKRFLITDGFLSLSGITFLEKPIPPEKLHRYYTKKFLLNEWIHYQKNDIFRLYKLYYPLNQDTSFDNQPISIQYDIRYHESRTDDYRSYSPEQTEHIHSAIEFYNPNKIIDAGCGSGAQYSSLQKILKKRNIHYTGIDASRFQIMKAIDLFSSPLSSFQLGDITNIGYPDNSFDLGFSESTLLFCADPLKGLKELDRVCNNGFFASLYTINDDAGHLKRFKKGAIFYLDTGATWKYYNKITPNVYKIPDYQQTKKLADSLRNTVVIRNDTDQFFEPLGIPTANLFFFPAEWYNSSKLENFSYHPLM